MPEGLNRSSSVTNWALLISEDNQEAKEALNRFKNTRKGKEYRLKRVPGIVPTWIEEEIK